MARPPMRGPIPQIVTPVYTLYPPNMYFYRVDTGDTEPSIQGHEL